MSDYEAVQRGGLKLKGVSNHGGKKKKKQDKEKKKIDEVLAVANSEKNEESAIKTTKTKAELAFERAKKKKSAQHIIERASKSHKERIMDFNQQLDNLTEHFDIPKVSWTK